jgi:MFS transporter, DHA1 family, tetracycline resistance protein
VGAAGIGFVFPAFFPLGANAVDEREQGAAAGAISSVQGLGAVLGPLFGALVYEADISAPYLLTGALLLVIALLVRNRPPSALDANACRPGVRRRCAKPV